ncbi:hydantoinase/carbamoylase family amidase [Fodinicurvata sp. EGI_FJ10296]|uniref:hydantoinase/carbamoylase family amidase n=1 Tax=Fodinicurvata sp. EGI_FJ10296 TaxID=3231908 RepID=UPI0034570140
MMTDNSFSFATRLLDGLEKETGDPSGRGMTRIAYGPGEEFAHGLFAELAREIGATVIHDAAGNTIAHINGKDPALPVVVTGSHLDSVRQGGNVDGAAGVAAGLACLKEAADRPGERGLSVVAFRGEESCWFPHSYIGSRMALGRLPAEQLELLRRSDTGRTLASHIDECGYDSAAVKRGEALLTPEKIDSFFEMHIEQGPVLETAGIPVGVVSAIAGGHRFRDMTVTGVWAHAGAEPRTYRHDAMAATAAFIDQTNTIWRGMEEDGDFLLVTFGIVQTDPELNAFSRIPGKVNVTIDIRAIEAEALKRFMDRLYTLIDTISETFGVDFKIGGDSGPPIRAMDDGLVALLEKSADEADIKTLTMPSGAGHDAAAFSEAGIPTAMVFIRSQNGSHNPDESMRIDDFRLACEVMGRAIARRRERRHGSGE